MRQTHRSSLMRVKRSGIHAAQKPGMIDNHLYAELPAIRRRTPPCRYFQLLYASLYCIVYLLPVMSLVVKAQHSKLVCIVLLCGSLSLTSESRISDPSPVVVFPGVLAVDGVVTLLANFASGRRRSEGLCATCAGAAAPELSAISTPTPRVFPGSC